MALTSSISAPAIWPTISASCRRPRGSAAASRVPNAAPASAFAAASAGSVPHASTASSPEKNASAIAVASRPTSSSLGRLRGPYASSSWISADASATPATLATAQRLTLSASSCRTSLARPAPSAARTASSRRRRAARADNRPPTLAQAMNSRQTTAANASHMPRLVRLPISWSESNSSRTSTLRLTA